MLIKAITSLMGGEDPTVQSQFAQQVVDVPEVESGHQCYKVADIPNTVVAGSNATIQLEYWSNMDNELGGRNQSFFACADIVSIATSSSRLLLIKPRLDIDIYRGSQTYDPSAVLQRHLFRFQLTRAVVVCHSWAAQ